MHLRYLLAAGAASLSISCALSTPVVAQETTSAMRGTVTVAPNEPVAGASVTIRHVPSGTVSRTTTSSDGSFNASGLRIGGPFEVVVDAEGYPEATVSDIYLTAGESYRLPISLEDNAIIVSAASISGAGSNSQGPSSAFSRNDIEGAASINRDIRDVVRRDPFATIDLTNSRAISIAGQNPRFNRFSVDGVQFSDDFGLNNGGLPTARGPVPLDAVGQISVKVAPYDITAGDLQGGAIDVVLLSGTNEFHGTGFYSYSNDSLTGDSVEGSDIDLDFKSEIYGALLRGPIIKDKLFFMVAGERTRETTPIDLGPSGLGFTNEVPGVTQGLVDQIGSIAQGVYGIDAGGVLSSSTEKDDKLVAKLDANISDTQRLALTYIYNDSSNFSQTGSSTSPTTPSYGLASNNYLLTERVHSGVIQLNSDWSDTFSTEVRGSYRKYKRGQDPVLGRNSAQFSVCADPTSQVDSATASSPYTCSTGVPVLNFGPDTFRQFNALENENFSGQVVGTLSLNNHQVRTLFGLEHVKTFNAFVPNALGSYYFDSIEDFQNGIASQLQYSNSPSLDLDDAAANFKYTMFTAGIQDDWEIMPNLTVSYGMRYDFYDMDTGIVLNTNFLDRLGFPNNYNLKGRGVFQPRLGFDWQVNDRLSIRGGGGIFSGGSPDVWISNSYSNTGVATNAITIRRLVDGTVSGGPADGLESVNGTTIPQSVLNAIANASVGATAPVNAIDPDLKLPSQWKASLSASYEADLGPLGDGWQLGADILYSKVRNQFLLVNGRVQPTGTFTLDGRPQYAPVTSPSDTNYDLILTNGTKGRSWIWTAHFDKAFDNGLSFGASYTGQDVTELNPLTSSTATSNYGNAFYVDPNYPAYGTANDEVKWQIKGYVGYEHAFFGDYKTRIQIFGEARSGRPYSYVMNDRTGSVSQIFGVQRNAARYLLYVPNIDAGFNGDPNVVYADQATFEALSDLINNSELKKYKGKTAPKNIGRSPDYTKIDIHIEQEIPTFVGSSRFTLFADIENFLNLIDDGEGVLKQVGFPYQSATVEVRCANAPACTQYSYSAVREPTLTTYSRQSLYQVRLGVRFSF
ncbi:hypothetical protein B2G71_03445 [Novosphingobium sp. PC22D]|uniref:TonB-dependent receptor n=1 Tax=Novosphingobium sp. PC22D TaxID=1962403 RepID=UPI000BF0D882|nr:TonB-dependent receptor [Novosphingobium sp. PC22D]PEQ14631.1 hypothetical protein B2G71_03445 [Novosphingobium sp. PC22D]